MIAEFYTKNKTKVTLLAARKGADFLELCVAVAWGLLLPTRPKRCFLGSFSWCHSGKKKQIDDVSPIKKGWFSSQTPCLVSGEWRQDITKSQSTGLRVYPSHSRSCWMRRHESGNRWTPSVMARKRKPGTSALGFNGPLIRESHAFNVWRPGAGNSHICFCHP